MELKVEYPKIETLYERGKNFKVEIGNFKNRVYPTISKWHFTEKIDGMNMRAAYVPGAPVKIDGRTDKAVIPDRLMQVMQETFTVAKFEAKFQSPVILYGEGYGAGIQRGGGLVENDSTQKFILFDVFVDNRWWLNYEAICDVAAAFGVKAVPDFGIMSLEEATSFVRAGFNSLVAAEIGKVTPAEGLVGKTLEPLFDKRGNRLVTKIKFKDF